MYKILLINLAFVGSIFAATAAQVCLLEEGEGGNLGYVPVPSCLSGHSSWLSVEAPREHLLPNANSLGGAQLSDIAFVEEFYVRTPTSGVHSEDHNRQFPIVGASILPGVRRVYSDVPRLTVDGATPPHALLAQPEISGLAMRSSEESASGIPNNRGFRILPGGRLFGRATGSFRVPRVCSFAGISRVESEDMMRQLSQESQSDSSSEKVALLELAASGRVDEKLTAVDKQNLHQAFLDAIPMAVQQYPFGDKKYPYSVVRLAGDHASKYTRQSLPIVIDQEWMTVIKDSHKPNRWVAIETDNTLYAQLAIKCDALGLRQLVDDCGTVEDLRPIRSMRTLRGDHIKTHSPKYYALRWFLKLMEAGENISESEVYLIRGRVKNILCYVFSLTDEEARLFIKTYFSDYGNTCADNAMEGLEQAEFAVEMRGTDEKVVFEAFLNKLKSDFVVGMSAVELFEDAASGAVSSRPRAIGWGESIETKIYITLLLSEVVDMGLHGHAMLYPKCAYRPRADLACRFFMQGFNGKYVLESLPLMPAFKEHACNCYIQQNKTNLASVVLDDFAQELVSQGKIGIDKARFYASLERAAQIAGLKEDAEDGGLAFYDEVDRLKTKIAHDYVVQMLEAYYKFR